MILRRVSLENVRSFLDKAELYLDGPISIIIGPNGGGKTNILDSVIMILRRYIFSSHYLHHAPLPDRSERFEFRYNDLLQNMRLERHINSNPNHDQIIEVDIVVTENDIENMLQIQRDAEFLYEKSKNKFVNVNLKDTTNNWNIENIKSGDVFTYRVINERLETPIDESSAQFFQYLQIFEIDSLLREEYNLSPLALPLLYFPTNRTINGINTSIELAGFNQFEAKRSSESSFSKYPANTLYFAIGRLAQKYRVLQENDNVNAKDEFKKDPLIMQLTSYLEYLGYEWSLETISAIRNHYDIRLKKQGISFLAGNASSGEREILSYIFIIFALNIRNALIIIDEPELHLHPRWQRIFLDLILKLTESTGNQFLFSTHSPSFISPQSIQYVSRVFSLDQISQIERLNSSNLPSSKNLFNIINSQNNEGIFFADLVVLVEGPSDRIVINAVLDHFGRNLDARKHIEVISVGGKNFFSSYSELLKACKMNYIIIADFDYLIEVGNEEISKLIELDSRNLINDVLDNYRSRDRDFLFNSIEDALASKSFEVLEKVWTYIKSKKKRIKPNLTDAERAILENFLAQMRLSGIFILNDGSLEHYLPKELKSKDLEKLIEFVSTEDFWERLPEHAKVEFETVTRAILS